MQFSLRQLFGFVTLCAVLSYLGVTIYNQYIAVAQLKHFLASHHVEVSDKNGVLTIDFNGHSIGSTSELVYSVINIRRYLPDVRELYFSDCEFYRIAPELSGWSSLRVLGSAYCKVTDEDLRAMMPLPNLRILDLMGSRVTSSGLRECKNVNHLQRIWLRSTPANDDSCDWLSEQSELRYVDLSESQITDIGAIRLIESRQLFALSIAQTQVTDKILGSLDKCVSLQELDLSTTQITPAVFRHALTLPNLKNLNISYTPAAKNEEGISQLEKKGVSVSHIQ